MEASLKGNDLFTCLERLGDDFLVSNAIACAVRCYEAILQSPQKAVSSIEIRIRFKVAKLLLSKADNLDEASVHLQRGILLAKENEDIRLIKYEMIELLCGIFYKRNQLHLARTFLKPVIIESLEVGLVDWTVQFGLRLAEVFLADDNYAAGISVLDQIGAHLQSHPILKAAVVLGIAYLQISACSFMEAALSLDAVDSFLKLQSVSEISKWSQLQLEIGLYHSLLRLALSFCFGNFETCNDSLFVLRQFCEYWSVAQNDRQFSGLSMIWLSTVELSTIVRVISGIVLMASNPVGMEKQLIDGLVSINEALKAPGATCNNRDLDLERRMFLLGTRFFVLINILQLALGRQDSKTAQIKLSDCESLVRRYDFLKRFEYLCSFFSACIKQASGLFDVSLQDLDAINSNQTVSWNVNRLMKMTRLQISIVTCMNSELSVLSDELESFASEGGLITVICALLESLKCCKTHEYKKARLTLSECFLKTNTELGSIHLKMLSMILLAELLKLSSADQSEKLATEAYQLCIQLNNSFWTVVSGSLLFDLYKESNREEIARNQMQTNSWQWQKFIDNSCRNTKQVEDSF